MKFNKFFMGVLGAMAFTACSSDEPINNPANTPEGEFGENFVSVTLEMPTAIGSRTTTADGLFDDGTDKESAVSNVVFFFFNRNDQCIDVQLLDAPDFKKPDQPSENPNITSYGTIEVRLKSGLTYENGKVVVALNSPADDANSLKAEVKTLSDLQRRSSSEYISGIKADGSNQVMSNSVYFADEETPTTKIWYNTITKDNIYTTADRPKIDELIAAGTKKYVDIYVERVASRIDVSEASFEDTEYYIYEENGTKTYTLTLFDHGNLGEETVTVRPVIKGMCLNVLAKRSRLIKPLTSTQVGYGVGTGSYKSFKWNDFDNKRSYWATTDWMSQSTTNYDYFSWDNAVAQGSAAFKQYINPNTQAYEPIASNEGNSENTKIMVVAELHKYVDGEDMGALDLVRFGADYMLPEHLCNYVASLVNTSVRGINWTEQNLTLGENPLTAAQVNTVARVVNNAFVGGEGDGLKGNMFKLEMLNPNDKKNEDGETVQLPGEADWEAKVSGNGIAYNSDFDFADEVSGLVNDENLSKTVKTIVDAKIQAAIDNINATQHILYWKDGKTYYYYNIRHQGFQGLVGGAADNFLYGVVRNHIYKVNLTGIYGLGTPVIEPGRPIDPDRPQNERPSFIKARINILPWRVVTNSAIIH